MNAVIFTRTSSAENLNRQNNNRQVVELTDYAKAQKYTIKKVYEEHISGAKKTEERALLMECLDYCKNNEIDIILFSALDRLGRNALEVQSIIKVLSDNKINAHFLSNDLTILDENGEVNIQTQLLITALSLTAQLERNSIKNRLLSGYQIYKDKCVANCVAMGRPAGTIESAQNKKNKYPIAVRCIQRGYTLDDTLKVCKERGEKVSLSTLKRLKKIVK